MLAKQSSVENTFTKTENRIYIALATLIWIYLFLRAVLVPLVHDEAATFFWYVHPGEFLPFLSHWDANNHILNSFLSWLSYKAFGAEEWALRLPNLLFAPLFFFYLYKLSTLLKQPPLRWLLIILLLLSHYFIGFFNLSRGYGMSMALMSGGIWYGIKAMQQPSSRNLITALLFWYLACLANLTLINSMIIISGILLLRVVFSENTSLKDIVGRIASVLFAGIIPLLFLAWYAFALKNKGALYYGLQDGFWEVTLSSITKYLAGSESLVFPVFIAIYFLLMIAGLIRLFISDKWKEHLTQPFFFLSILFLGNILATILLNVLFGVNYPEDRAALFFYPLFVLSLIFISDRIFRPIRRKGAYLLFLPLLWIPLHFMININFTHDLFFWDQRLPERFYEQVRSAHSGKYPPGVQANAMRHFVWQYYTFMDEGKEIKVQYKNHPSFNKADFIIVRPENNPQWRIYYDSLDYDPPSELYLMKRKNALKKDLLKTISDEYTQEGITDREFFTLYKGPVDSLKNESLYIGLNLDIDSPHKPLVLNVVVEVRNAEGQFVQYESLELDWLKTDWTGEEIFTNGMLIPQLPVDSETILVYLWNREKQRYRLNGYQMEMFVLEGK